MNYAGLLGNIQPRIIRSEEENQHFTGLLEEITRKRRKGDKATSAEEQLAELLIC